MLDYLLKVTIALFDETLTSQSQVVHTFKIVLRFESATRIRVRKERCYPSKNDLS